MTYDVKSRMHRAFLENIQARRTELGLTQSEVAERMGIARSSYAQLENGRCSPTIEMIERVAKALKIDPLELIARRSVAA